MFNFREEYIARRNLVAWSFVNLDNPLELVDIIITHNADTLDTIYKRVTDISVPIPIASIDALVDMKKISDRPQDREDIKALERLR